MLLIYSLYRQSRACVLSTSVICRSVLYSYSFLELCLIMNILSTADLYGQNPTWNYSSFFNYVHLAFNNIVNTVYAILSSVIDLQCYILICLLYCILGIFNWTGNCFLSHILKLIYIVPVSKFLLHPFLFYYQFQGYIICTTSFVRFLFTNYSACFIILWW